jgi:predicted nuclease of predicted toxin-antitoxin system
VRLLFDQNLPHDLRDLLAGHDIKVAVELGWETLANGDLLEAAEQAGFDAMLTADQSIKYQQRLTGRRIALVVLSTNHWPTLEANGGRILHARERIIDGGYQEVTLARPKLPRRPPPGAGR